MSITTGGFEDLVQLSQDTLYYVGPDLEIGNTSVGSSAGIGFNNTAGNLAIVGVATGNATVNLPQGGGTLLTNVNVSAGTTSNNLSAVAFSNFNNASIGLNGSTLTMSAPVNFSAGTTSNNLTQWSFSNGNGITWGLNGGTITASAGSTTVSVVNFTAGTTSANLATVAFSNSYNVSFGLNISTITASANLTNDWYDNIVRAGPIATGSGAMGVMSNLTGSVSSLFVCPLHGFGELFPYDITANTCFFPDISISGSTATMSVAFTSKWFFGIYTLNASSLSLLNSGSVSFGFGAAATNNSTGFAGGFRYGSINGTGWSSSPVFKYGSRYWLAWFWSSAGVVNQTASMAGAFMGSTGQRSGLLGANGSSATSNGWAPFYGVFTAQTAALPVSIGSNQLQKTASIAGFVPHFVMANNVSLTVF